MLALVASLLAPSLANVANADHSNPPITDSNPCDDFIVGRADGRSPNRHQTVAQVFGSGPCALEQEVIAVIAAERGVALTNAIRDEILSYGRSEVRARLFERIATAADKAVADRSVAEQQGVDWLVARYRDTRIAMAEATIVEYDKWAADRCAYVPPSPYTYRVFASSCTGLAALFTGGPRPPSSDDFVSYGVARVAETMSSANGVPDIQEQFAADFTVLAATIGVSASVLSAALYIGLSALVHTIFPYIGGAAAGLSNFVAIGGFAGPVAIIVLAAVIIAIRTVQIVKDAQIPGELDDNLADAEAIDASDLTDPGVAQIVGLAFVDATAPDHPNPPSSAVPAATPPANGPLFETQIGDSGAVTTGPIVEYVDPDGTVNRAWIHEGWWVIDPIEPDGPIRLDPQLEYWDQDGLPAVARIKGDDLYVLHITGDDIADQCPSPSCEITDTLSYTYSISPSRQAGVSRFLGSPPQINAGPTVIGTTDDGATVTLDVDAVDPFGGALTYTWTLTRTLLSGGSTVSQTYAGESPTHTFAGSGSYELEVTVARANGATASASATVDVASVPADLIGRTSTGGAGVFVEGPWSEGSTAGEFKVETTAGLYVEVDWDRDGVFDSFAIADGDGNAFFVAHPAFDEGTPLVDAKATDLGTNDIVAEEALPIDVINAAPTNVEVEIFDPATSAFRSAPLVAPLAFREGDTVRARMRATDPGGDLLDFQAAWIGRTPSELIFVIEKVDGVASGEWVEISYRYLDQVTDRFFFAADLGVLVSDDVGERADGVAKAYITVGNVAPTVDDVTTQVDDQGNVQLDALLGDAVVAPLDITGMTIDWGDGSAVDDASLDRVFADQVLVDKVAGHGTHQYAAPGNYDITVTVLDDGPSSDREVVSIVVLPFRPVIADVTTLQIGPEDTTSDIGVSVADSDTALADVAVSIDWGDGSPLSLATFDAATSTHDGSHVYAAPGDYTVTLVANDGDNDSEPFEGAVAVAQAVPGVTIEQGANQADGTSDATVVFDVVFSEPVTGFDSDDVSVSGTAAATTASVAAAGAEDGTAYTVTVSGMTATGTVLASIPAGVAFDADANGNAASSSSDNSIDWVQLIELALPGTNGVLTVPNDPGSAGAEVTYAVTATGGSGTVTITCEPPSGSFFPIGSTSVVCTATDENSGPAAALVLAELIATETFSVVVEDVESPVFAPTAAIVAVSADGQPIVVDFATPVASDNSGQASVACLPASGTQFPVGVTSVTCTATDAAGNAATSQFSVDVQNGTTTTPTTGLPATGGGLSRLLTMIAAILLLVGASVVLLGRRSRRVARSA